jgi:hypothetical protein
MPGWISSAGSGRRTSMPWNGISSAWSSQQGGVRHQQQKGRQKNNATLAADATFGVGIMIAHNLLHGSGQAGFSHPALALGEDAQAMQWIGMTDGRHRQPASAEAPHAFPQHREPSIAPLFYADKAQEVAYVHRVSDRAGFWHTSRYRRIRWGLPLLLTASASRSNCLTRLNTRPARSSVNRFDAALASSSA